MVPTIAPRQETRIFLGGILVEPIKRAAKDDRPFFFRDTGKSRDTKKVHATKTRQHQQARAEPQRKITFLFFFQTKGDEAIS